MSDTQPNATKPASFMQKFNEFLDNFILPWPVRFLTFRFVILLTIAMLIPLIVWANNTVMVLLLNSYLNTMSVAVSSIVLLYATISEVRQKQIADLQEKRAQEDHFHVCEMHTLVLTSLQNQQQEIQELRELLALMNGQVYQRPEKMEIPDVYASHPRGCERFDQNDHVRRFQKGVHHNRLATRIRESMISNSPKQPDKN